MLFNLVDGDDKVAKRVAKTLSEIPASPIMQAIIDRNINVDDIVRMLKEHWSYDLYSRKPGPAFTEDGVFHPTDLDLACFLSALADRKAVINLPRYECRRPKTMRTDEVVTSVHNRHGHIIGMRSNQDALSFSVTVKDANVIVKKADGNEEVGAPRSFMVVDIDGSWYDGWSRIEFLPTAKENDFLKDKKLWTENTVYFKHFVHPARWQSMFGQYYFLTKALIDRLVDEATFYRSEVKRLEAKGIKPLPRSDDEPEWDEDEKPLIIKEAGRPIEIDTIKAEVDIPDFIGTYRPCPESSIGLSQAKNIVHKIQYGDLPALRFATRATEYACLKSDLFNEGKTPGWISEAKWESYKAPRARTTWNRMVVAQERPGVQGYALRYRKLKRTETVAI